MIRHDFQFRIDPIKITLFKHTAHIHKTPELTNYTTSFKKGLLFFCKKLAISGTLYKFIKSFVNYLCREISQGCNVVIYYKSNYNLQIKHILFAHMLGNGYI